MNDFGADHTSGVVWWDISCDAPRSVAVDATAFHGTADDHEIVDHQVHHATVRAGETWHGVAVFPTETTPSTDQISAQAVSFVTDDPAERPAILGRVSG